ncbi:hypothetical protein [Bifidobacterium goeldii]
MVQRKSAKAGAPRSSASRTSAIKGRKRKLSKQQRAMYRRRRIVVGVALLVVIALIIFCIYSLGRGLAAIGDAMTPDEVTRSAVPEPKKTSGVKDCGKNDIKLELTAASQSVPLAGSLDFSATIRYTGSASCLINASNESRVLTISSGNDVIWRSDSCPADSRMLLMAKGDKKTDTITWNTSRTGDTCVENQDDLPKVDRGTYIARLSLKDHPAVTSDPVTITVQ